MGIVDLINNEQLRINRLPPASPLPMQLHHQRRQQLLIFRQSKWLMGSDDNDQVVSRGQIVLMMPKRFAQQALDAVAPHGVPDWSADGDTEARVIQIVGNSIHHQWPARLPHLGREDR